jgi:hypothetical protein
MANQALIKGAGIAADTFSNIQGGFNAGLQAGYDTEAVARALRQAQYQRNQDEAELKNYVNSMDTIDVAKVEPGMRDEVNNFLIQNRNKYAKAARTASELDADDPAYMKAISTMNEINGSFKALSENLDLFKQKREQYYDDTKNNRISEASIINGNTDNLNSLFKNNDFDIVIEPTGTFQINHDGDYIPFSDFEKDTDYNYHLVNNVGFNQIMELTNKAQNGGAKIENALETNYKYQLNGMFNTMGREDMMSMIYDTVISDTPLNMVRDKDGNSTNGWDDSYLDMENDKQLRTWLANTYLQGLKKVALGSYNQQRAVADQKIRDAARKSRKIAEAKQKVNDKNTLNISLDKAATDEEMNLLLNYVDKQAKLKEITLPTE